MTALKTIKHIEAERRRIEYNGVRAAAYQGQLACLRAKQAIRLGHNPIDAAKAVLLGNDRLGHSGIAQTLANTMVLAHLRGMKRSVLQARSHGIFESQKMSRESDERKRKDEEDALIALLLLDDDEIAALRLKYKERAEAIVGGMMPSLEERIEPIARRLEAIPTKIPIKPMPGQEPELKIPDETREVTEEFTKSGFLPTNPYAISNAVATATVDAYEQGRRDGWDIPQIKESLWGFHYCAVLDNRTTELCRSLDGMTAPIDDPVWLQWTPPNHFCCRSMVIEVWKSSELNEPEIIQPRASADDMERFRAMRDKFRRYQ